MDRYELIKIIPKPSNSEVIVYNIELKDLIDIDVFSDFENSYSVYKLKKENYLLLKNELEEYENFVNNIYLFNKSWSETDYLEALKNDKITYSKMFNDIKQIENNLKILDKKYIAINEKIEIQKANDVKKLEKKRVDIDSEIEILKNKITVLKEQYNSYKIEHKKIKEQIQNNQEEKEILDEMLNSIKNNKYHCKYCGTIVRNINTKERMRNLTNKNIENNKLELEELKESLQKNKKNIQDLENEITLAKQNLQNDIEFQKQDYNFYIKKSVEVLKLEAERNKILEQIQKQKNMLKNNPKAQKQTYIDLKTRIQNCELSLENLTKLRENKETFKSKYETLNSLKKELQQLYKKLTLEKKFIEIYYKICEQKLNDYFSNNIKFKLFNFDDFELKEILNVTINGIEYSQLSYQQQKEFEEIYNEKLSYFSK